MSHRVSLILTLIPHEQKWVWRLHQLYPSIQSQSCGIIYPYSLPHSTTADEIEELLIEKNKHSYIDLRNIGLKIYNALFPQEIKTIIENSDSGDIYFEVSSEWASVPFELCYIHDKGFLGNIFQIGTSIFVSNQLRLKKNINSSGKEHPHFDKMLIIADPAGDLQYAYEEGTKIKKIAEKCNVEPHFVSSGVKEKILGEIAHATIVHFSGHSITAVNNGKKLPGWKLSQNSILDIDDMAAIGENSFIPYLVFSNSCYAGNCSDDLPLTGLAIGFIKARIPFVIGPISKIESNEALDFALLFYRRFFKHGSPSLALLEAKRRTSKHNPYSIAPLYYRLFGNPRDFVKYKKPDGILKIIWRKIQKIPSVITIMLMFIILAVVIYLIPSKKQKIVIGITNYSVNSNTDVLLKELNVKIVKPANKKLKDLDSRLPYIFKGRVVPGEYSKIIEEINSGKIHIGFISPYCYINQRYLRPESLKGLQLIGSLKKLGERVYYSGFIVHKNSHIKTINDITRSNVKTIIFGLQKLSTSTCIVPSIFCIENGLKDEVLAAQQLDRPEMLEQISDSQNIIGALSNEDWLRVQEQQKGSHFRFISISNIPIPYDPVFVHKTNWNSLVIKKFESSLLKALNNSVSPMNRPWEEEYRDFVDYIASGVIVRKVSPTSLVNNNDKQYYVVDLAPGHPDLYNLKSTIDRLEKKNKDCKADIYEFKKNRLILPETLTKRKLGSGTLIKNSALELNEVLLIIEKSLNADLIGNHVLINKTAGNRQ